MGRAPCCDKANVKKGPWSPEEDNILKSYIEKYGTGGNWIALPQKIGLRRCGKSCRLRWLNYLRPNIKHGGFSEEEENVICSLYLSIGSRWSIIAGQLPGRTDNDIKNYWNTRLKKKLLQQSKQRRQYQNPPPNHTSTLGQDIKWECDNNSSSDHNTMIKFCSHDFQQPMTTLPSLLVPPEETTSDFHHQALTNNLEMSSDYYNIGQEFQDEMGCNNLYKWDGIESLFLSGVDNMVSTSMVRSNSASTENTCFEDINSLVYYPIFSNYEIRENDHIQQGCSYEEMGRFGVQQGSFV